MNKTFNPEPTARGMRVREKMKDEHAATTLILAV
jgi:hypothetical protein